MEEELETIEILNAKGEMVRINKTDFDANTMKPFKEVSKKSDAKMTLEDSIAQLESTTPTRCKFVKKTGEQCSNDTTKDSEFCWIKTHR